MSCIFSYSPVYDAENNLQPAVGRLAEIPLEPGTAARPPERRLSSSGQAVQSLTEEVLKSSEIEGEILDRNEMSYINLIYTTFYIIFPP